ncbi:hypothetical protein [Actinokineospora sp. HUAS TT18]|uniref:hypothetical protein n=1 Tax=Actinokineospora sp. HUAS TT18 TaxID=3447451 RepID=UPI003F51F226
MRKAQPTRRRPVVAGTRRRTAVAVLDETPVDDTLDETSAEAESTDVESTDVESTDVEPDAESPEPRKRTPVVLVGFAVAVAAAGVVAMVAAGRVTPDNAALVDTGETGQVIQEIDAGLEQIFSYRFDDTKATEDAAKNILVGDAKAQYEKLFDQVRQHSGEQKLTLRSRVAVSGVTALSGDRAQLLVFIDQSATRGDTDVSSSGAAQLSVSAEQIDGHWRITSLRSL